MKRILGMVLSSWVVCGMSDNLSAQPAPTTEQFMSALGTCAANMDLKLSADILGSIKSIYEGSKTQGTVSLKNAPEFLSLFPEAARKDVYVVYVECVTKILGVSKPRISQEEVKICTETLAQCKNDFRTNVSRAIESCQRYISCDQNNPEAYSLLGQSFRTAGQISNAERSFERQLELGRQLKDQYTIAHAYQSLAITYTAKQVLDKAEELVKKSIEINIKGNRAGLAANYKALADIYFRRGRLPDAENYFLRAMSIMKEIDDKFGLANAYVGLGFTKLRMNERAAGCSNLVRAYELYKEIGFTRGIEDTERNFEKTRCR